MPLEYIAHDDIIVIVLLWQLLNQLTCEGEFVKHAWTANRKDAGSYPTIAIGEIFFLS